MNGIGFSYEIIRDYLIREGGKVEYHKLIKHFKDALANPENKEARVLFKDLVNQVAIVTTEGNQKYLSLRTNLIEQPPKLPPRSTSQTDNQLNHNDSKINLNYPATSNYQQSTANQYYDTQNKFSSQSQLNQIVQQTTSNKYINQQFNPLQQNFNQQRIHSNLDLTMNMINNHQFNNQINQNKNQFNILDTQPRQPFSYNLSQPIPTLLNQRIHPVEMNNQNNLDLNNVLIQPKPVPQIQQMPINNLMNVNLVNRYSNQNKQFQNNNIDNQQNPPLPAKNMWSNNQANGAPPKAPPRRKSFASSSNTYLNKKGTTVNTVKDNENFIHSSPKQFTDKIKEINELKFNSPGRVKEHAKKLNKMVSESKLPMPLGNNNLTNIQNNQIKDDTDLNDQVKRRWMVKSSCCDYNELQQMLKDYPKLAEFKDISSGWTALHWAAKFNKPDIIKLIAGTHNVNPNIKTFSGYTPIHIAALFDNKEIIELLTKGYDADPTIRDHTGRTADEILRINRNKTRIKPENGISRKNEQETGSKGFLARTASLRQGHKLLDRLPSKYRTNPK